MLNSLARLVTKRSIEIRGKGHLATSPEERNGFNEDQKFCQEKQRARSYFFALTNFSPFHFFCPGLLFKVLGYVTNSLLLRSAIRGVNEICKSRSRAKVREESQNSAGLDTSESLHFLLFGTSRSPLLLVQAIVKHSFSPTSPTF